MGVIGAGSLGFHHVRILRDMDSVSLAGFVESNDELMITSVVIKDK